MCFIEVKRKEIKNTFLEYIWYIYRDYIRDNRIFSKNYFRKIILDATQANYWEKRYTGYYIWLREREKNYKLLEIAVLFEFFRSLFHWLKEKRRGCYKKMITWTRCPRKNRYVKIYATLASFLWRRGFPFHISPLDILGNYKVQFTRAILSTRWHLKRGTEMLASMENLSDPKGKREIKKWPWYTFASISLISLTFVLP